MKPHAHLKHLFTLHLFLLHCYGVNVAAAWRGWHGINICKSARAARHWIARSAPRSIYSFSCISLSSANRAALLWRGAKSILPLRCFAAHTARPHAVSPLTPHPTATPLRSLLYAHIRRCSSGWVHRGMDGLLLLFLFTSVRAKKGGRPLV